MSVIKKIDGKLVYKLPSEKLVDTGICSLCGINKAKKKNEFTGVNRKIKTKIVKFITGKEQANICQSCTTSLNAVIQQHECEIRDGYMVHCEPTLEDHLIDPIFHYEYKELWDLGDTLKCNDDGPIACEKESDLFTNACNKMEMKLSWRERDIHDCADAYEELKQYRFGIIAESEDDIELISTQFLINLLKREESRIAWENKGK